MLPPLHCLNALYDFGCVFPLIPFTTLGSLQLASTWAYAVHDRTRAAAGRYASMLRALARDSFLTGPSSDSERDSADSLSGAGATLELQF